MPNGTTKSNDSFVEDSFVEDSFAEDNKRSAVPLRRPSFTETVSYPGAFVNKGISQFSTNPLAGTANIATGILNTPGSVFSAIDYGLRQLPGVGGFYPGQGLADVLSFPPRVIGSIAENVQGLLNKGLPESNLGMTPEHAEEASQAVSGLNQTLAQYAAPQLIARTAPVVGRAVNAGRQNIADALTQSSLKIPPSVKASERTGLLRTAQEYGVTPRMKGVDKLDARVSDLKNLAEGFEQKAIKGGNAKIPTADLVSSVDGLIEKWSKSDTPEQFTNILKNYKDKVLEQQKPELDIQQMVDLKRNLQNQLKSVYVKQMKINPSMRNTLLQEAKSAVEVSVKTKLEELIPEYKDVNSQIHRLLKLKPFVEQAANRISNQDLTTIRLKDLMFGGAGAITSHDPVGTVTAVVLGRVITDPRIQAYLGNKIAPAKTPWEPSGGLPPSPRSIIEQQGLKYRGGNGSGLIFFDDPQTGSTLAIQKNEFSPQAIRAKVQASRLTFGH